MSSATPAQRNSPLHLWTSAVLWCLALAVCLPFYFAVPGLGKVILGASGAFSELDFGWLVILVLAALVFLMLGVWQKAVIRRIYPDKSGSWTKRTVIGGVLGLLAYLFVLALLRDYYYGGPLLSYWGFFILDGDLVEVGVTVAGWMVAGALVGLSQWLPAPINQRKLWPTISWSLASALAWGAGAMSCWALFKLYVIGYEPICISCLVRLVYCAAIAACVIAIAGGIAILNRYASMVFSVLVGIGIAFLMSNSPTPVFTPRAIHPYKVLEPENADPYPFVESVAFSDDGAILGAVKAEKRMGENVGVRVLLWNTSGWTQIATIKEGETSTPLMMGLVPAVAETTLQRDKLYIRSQLDGSILHTIDFHVNTYINEDRLPEGYKFKPPSGFEEGQLETPSRQTLTMDPYPVPSYHSPNRVYYDYSPDGRHIAAGYTFGGIWVWRIP
ncbi:MAG: hypothetical protein M3441_14160 [Chloroflexota bacterium]|nr:hypothetical protein [Chloroflexota bacterium]